MLEKQLREIKELREQLTESVISLTPSKSKGLQIVAMPCKAEIQKNKVVSAQAKRAYFANKNAQPLKQKLNLRGFKVAA